MPTDEGNPCDVLNADKRLSETDYSSGILNFTRYYHSQRPSRIGMGSGWTHTYNGRLALSVSFQHTLTPLGIVQNNGHIDPFLIINNVRTSTSLGGAHISGSGSGTNWTVVKKGGLRDIYNYEGQLLQREVTPGIFVDLVWENGRLIRVEDPFGRTLAFTYDSNSRLRTLTDPDGNVTAYDYDSADNLIAVTRPDTAQRHYHYEDSRFPNFLTGITDENGNRYATYAYDADGRAILTEHAGGIGRIEFIYTDDTTTVTESLGDSTATRTYHFTVIGNRRRITSLSGDHCDRCGQGAQSQTYDGRYPDKVRDWNGNLTDYDYALNLESQRIEAVGTPQERIIQTEWNLQHRLPARITEPGKITEYSYDAHGNRLSETVTDTATNESRSTRYSYNSFGQVLTIDGPRTDVNDLTAFEYDNDGNRIRIINALNQVTEIPDYDPHGNPLTVIDPNGLRTELNYDARQRLIQRTVAAGTVDEAVTRFEYDGVGNLIRITQPNGAFLQYHYDAAQRLTGIEDNLGNRIDYQLDMAGNRTGEAMYDPDGILVKTQTAVFNNLSRLIESLGADNQTTQYTYDPNGNATHITDPKNQITVQAYDALNRLIQTVDSALGETQYGYDALDHLTAVTDPNGLTTDYDYNAFGDLIEQNSPDTGLTTYAYDAAGNRIQMTDARGVTVQYRYDALNRLTDIDYAGIDEDIAYIYDEGFNSIGRLSHITDSSGLTEYHYDIRGNVIEVSFKPALAGEGMGEEIILTTQYAYDLADNLIQMTYPGGAVVNYIRNPLGQIIQVDRNGQTLVTDIDYLPFGPLKSLTYGNSLTETRTYDLDYRITGITVPGIHNLSYSYDLNSNIEGIESLLQTDQSQTFGYDALDRLLNAQGGYGVLSYGYDPVGNRTQEILTTEGTEHTELYAYGNQRHHLLQRGDIQYQYDAVGNTIHNGEFAFHYNHANRLNEVLKDGDVIAVYRYNALGQRTLKVTGTTDTTDYIALAEEQDTLAAQYHAEAEDKQNQAEALENIAHANEQQAQTHQEAAEILRQDAIQDRIEATALDAEAIEWETEAQPWVERAQNFRDRIVDPPQNIGQRLRNIAFTLVAGVFQAIADVYLNQAEALTTDAHALRDSALEKEQQATDLELEAAQLLIAADRALFDADTLREEANEFIVLAEQAEANAEEYRILAETPQQVQTTILFAYDLTGQLIGEYDTTGNAIREYVYLSGQPLALIQTNAVHYYHNDHLGTPKKLTGQNQQIVWSATHDPFGEANITIEQATNNLRFPGQYEDSETGLSYNYHRYYDDDTGRYITSDPIGLQGGLNSYLYANANPVRFTDPLGLLACPGGAWSTTGLTSESLFFGGGVATSSTTFTCKSNKKKCKATTLCFGGGIIAAAGIGGEIGNVSGVSNSNQFNTFSSGVYIAAGPISMTITGNSDSVGIGKSLGFGAAYVTCIVLHPINCDEDCEK